MVTCRQIKALTAARRSGESPSWEPAQWNMMATYPPKTRKSVGARTAKLPRIKAATTNCTSVESTAEPTKTGGSDEACAAAAGEDTDVASKPPRDAMSMFDRSKTKFPLKPFRWPTTKDEQLQTILAIRRMLRELYMYLQANSSTLIEALPRMSVSGDGLVKVSTLHEWLCLLKREPSSGGSLDAANNSRPISSKDGANPVPKNSVENKISCFSSASSATEARRHQGSDELGALFANVRKYEVSEKMVENLKRYFDVDGSGRARIRDVLAAIRVAKRLALEHDAESLSTRKRKVVRAQGLPDKSEAASECQAKLDDAAPQPEVDKSMSWYVDEEESQSHLVSAPEETEEEEPEEVPSLASSFGPVFETDVHDLVDVLFSDSEARSGLATLVSLEELEAQVRFLRRIWAVTRATRHQAQGGSEDVDMTALNLTWVKMLGDGYDEARTRKFDDGTWERLMQRVACVLASLEDHLATCVGMRFMEFVKTKAVVRGSSEPTALRAAVNLTRKALLDLFDVPIAERTKAALQAAKAARDAQQRAILVERQAAAREAELRLKRSGIGPLLRRVETLLKRRGLRPREVLDLIESDGTTVAIENLVALIKAIHVRHPPRSCVRSRQLKMAREVAAAAAVEARRKKETDFIVRMHAAEKSGVLTSFAKLDHFFRRYQLAAEDIWGLGKSAIRKRHEGATGDTKATAATTSRCGSVEALGPEAFHDLLNNANIAFTLDQVKSIVNYLDTDGNGSVEFNELNAALLDYRRFKRTKRRFEIRRAHAEHRLFLDQHVTLLLQYLILITHARDTNGSNQPVSMASLSTNNSTTGSSSLSAIGIKSLPPDNEPAAALYAVNVVGGPEEQYIHVVDMQRVIEKATLQAIPQYFREIRERLHADAYIALQNLNQKKR